MTRTQHVAVKGTREGLVLYLDPAAEFNIIREELAKHLGESAQFLQGSPVRCYGGEKEYSAEQCRNLAEILEKHGLELAGWLKAEEVYVPGKQPLGYSGEKEIPVFDDGMVEGNCLFIEKTLRSGKSVQYDGHIIVLGDVNPGAEIIASGNIIVMGALRGVAHAGATGDRNAMVSAYVLAPTQLRIADFVTRAPDDKDGGEGPEIAKIKEDRLIVEGFAITGWRGKAR